MVVSMGGRERFECQTWVRVATMRTGARFSPNVVGREVGLSPRSGRTVHPELKVVVRAAAFAVILVVVGAVPMWGCSR